MSAGDVPTNGTLTSGRLKFFGREISHPNQVVSSRRKSRGVPKRPFRQGQSDPAPTPDPDGLNCGPHQKTAFSGTCISASFHASESIRPCGPSRSHRQTGPEDPARAGSLPRTRPLGPDPGQPAKQRKESVEMRIGETHQLVLRRRDLSLCL